MAKRLVVKRAFKEELVQIPVTRWSDKNARLVGYNGDDKVCDFPTTDKVDYWYVEDVESGKREEF